MNESPLQLQTCHFTKINLSTQRDANPADTRRVDVGVASEAFAQSPERPRQWVVVVRIKIGPQENAKPGYLGELEGVGLFEVESSWPEEEIEKLVFINGSGMVYAALRELVSNITARGFWQILVLPTHSFFKDFLAKEKADRTPQIAEVTESKTAAA